MSRERDDERERRDEIVRGLKPFVHDSEVYELRILECVDNPQRSPYHYTASGFYDSDHLTKLADDALHRMMAPRTAFGCYVTMNPVDPNLLAVANNRTIKAGKETDATSDDYIVARRRLTIDIDPERKPGGISATDEEKALALELAEKISSDLSLQGWPEPILADSGNGYHLNHAVDLPVADGGLVERFLKSLSAKYSTPAVKVDTALFNPSRIIRLYGTMARKGDSTTTRPHRWSMVISGPEELTVVDLALIEAYIRDNPLPEPEPKSPPASSQPAQPSSVPRPSGNGDLKPADDFNQRGEWIKILPASWKEHRKLPGGEIQLTRPGKDSGVSATLYHNKGLHVFTSSEDAAPFKAGGNYSKFDAYALLYHGGKLDDAAKALWKLGYGSRSSGAGREQGAPNNGPVSGNGDTSGAASSVQVTGDGKPRSKQQPSHADILMGLAKSVVLFHTPDDRCFARIFVANHHETHEIKSTAFQRWLTRGFHEREGKPPTAESLQSVIALLEAQAMFDWPEESVHVRVAPAPDGSILIDLGTPAWDAVKITPGGWAIVADPPVRFIRHQGGRPLPIPERGGSLENLWDILNITGDDRLLFIGWLTQSLRPNGPYPILFLAGEQGTAKSTVAKIARSIIDPHTAMLRLRTTWNRGPDDQRM